MNSLSARHARRRSEAEVSFDEFLGAAERRYFGRGYRKTRYSVEVPGAEGPSVACVVPDADAWRTRTAPHLTSIDAIALPLLMIDELRPRDAALEVLQTVSVTAGASPWLDLDHVPVSVHSEWTSEPGGHGRIVRARSGSFRTLLRLVPAEGVSARGSGPTVYGSAYRDIEVHTRLTSVTPDAVLAAHTPDFSRTPERVTGTDAPVWPGLTAMTWVATMGQLTQVALLAATGLGRRETGNLWMRRMSLDFTRRGRASPGTVTTETRVTGRRAAARQDPELQTVDVRSVASDGVVATASLAYRSQTQ